MAIDLHSGHGGLRYAVLLPVKIMTAHPSIDQRPGGIRDLP